MTIYYHGGPAGRQRGHFILPPTITKAPSCSEFGAAGVHRRDRVYVTTEFEGALLFAAGHRRGRVYQVEVLGDLEPDPDCETPGVSFQCPRARVVKVIVPAPFEFMAARNALLGDQPC